jgi:hypothetical protein
LQQAANTFVIVDNQQVSIISFHSGLSFIVS